MLLSAPQTLRRRDIFLEGVGRKGALVYRAYHRPTGLVVELTYGGRPPPYNEVVKILLLRLILTLEKAIDEEGPFYAPVA